ncbi:MAG: class I SAM-dependent methyltransferase [Candidatus Freyarchaeota archaeon]|nr:class I SAM-dependent methyltransferase [Candidatus Freyrarchaeum guaymaensis]
MSSNFERALEECLKPLKIFDNYEAWLAWFKGAEARANLYLSKIKMFTKNLSGLRALDVGCGVGGVCSALAKLSNHMVGVEINEVLLPLAKLNVENSLHESSSVDFVLASGLNLPFRENSFDLVLCNDVLEHVSDKEKLIKEIFSVLRKDGHLFLTTPNRLYPIEPHTGMIGVTLIPRRLANKLASYKFGFKMDLPDLVTYKHLVALIKSNGFKFIINHPKWLTYDNVKIINHGIMKRLLKSRAFTWMLALFSPLFTALCKKPTDK